MAHLQLCRKDSVPLAPGQPLLRAVAGAGAALPPGRVCRPAHVRVQHQHGCHATRLLLVRCNTATLSSTEGLGKKAQHGPTSPPGRAACLCCAFATSFSCRGAARRLQRGVEPRTIWSKLPALWTITAHTSTHETLPSQLRYKSIRGTRSGSRSTCGCHAAQLPAVRAAVLPQPKRLDLRMMRRNSSGDTSPSPSRSASAQGK